VRNAADRMSCANNLHQIGLATINYQSTTGHYPKATLENSELEPVSRLSWFVSIVPYIEADNLYSRIAKDKAWDSEENRFVAVMDYRTFHCPVFPHQPPSDTLSPAHYRGITGVGANAAT